MRCFFFFNKHLVNFYVTLDFENHYNRTREYLQDIMWRQPILELGIYQHNRKTYNTIGSSFIILFFIFFFF